jgi:hypothetical protein
MKARIHQLSATKRNLLQLRKSVEETAALADI